MPPWAGTGCTARFGCSRARRHRHAFGRATCAALESALLGAEGIEGAALPFIAAKTGTSSGLRDAIAAGWNARYAAVVWIGRFDGGSDPALVGGDSALPLLERLLHHPTLRTTRPLRAEAEWLVRDQVAAIEGRQGPRIIEPRDGDRLVARNGEAFIIPRIEDADGRRTTLFLDGRPIEVGRRRIALGAHELRLVGEDGARHVIDFEVVPAPDGRR